MQARCKFDIEIKFQYKNITCSISAHDLLNAETNFQCNACISHEMLSVGTSIEYKTKHGIKVKIHFKPLGVLPLIKSRKSIGFNVYLKYILNVMTLITELCKFVTQI